MKTYQEPQENEGNDGFIWSKRLAVLWTMGLTVAAALVGGGFFINGGFIGFSQ